MLAPKRLSADLITCRTRAGVNSKKRNWNSGEKGIELWDWGLISSISCLEKELKSCQKEELKGIKELKKGIYPSPVQDPFNIKMPSYRYGQPNAEEKTRRCETCQSSVHIWWNHRMTIETLVYNNVLFHQNYAKIDLFHSSLGWNSLRN